MSHNWNHTVHGFFRLAFFHLVIRIRGPLLSFHGFIAHFLLVLNNTPVPGYTRVNLFIHGHNCFQVLTMKNKAIVNILEQVLGLTWIYKSFGSTIIVSYYKIIFNFKTTLALFSKIGFTNLHFHQQWIRVSVDLNSLGIVSMFDF